MFETVALNRTFFVNAECSKARFRLTMADRCTLSRVAGGQTFVQVPSCDAKGASNIWIHIRSSLAASAKRCEKAEPDLATIHPPQWWIIHTCKHERVTQIRPESTTRWWILGAGRGRPVGWCERSPMRWWISEARGGACRLSMTIPMSWGILGGSRGAACSWYHDPPTRVGIRRLAGGGL